MSDILGTLFGGNARVRVMRLFIFNQGRAFELSDIARMSSVSDSAGKKAVGSLIGAKFIKPKVFFKLNEIRNKKKSKKRKVKGFVFNENFPFTGEFQNMLMASVPLKNPSIVRRFSKSGNLKLLITAGVFIHNPESRIDLLIVGERLSKKAIDRAVKSLEREIGSELRYAVFETGDFNYRMSVQDKLIRDVFDYPHRKLINKIGPAED